MAAHHENQITPSHITILNIINNNNDSNH